MISVLPVLSEIFIEMEVSDRSLGKCACLEASRRVDSEVRKMGRIFLSIAVWNTAVVVVNTTVLPAISGSWITDLMTPFSQVAPIAIPLAVWMALNLRQAWVPD